MEAEKAGRARGTRARGEARARATDATRQLVEARGGWLMGTVAVGLGMGRSADEALGEACGADPADLGCVAAHILATMPDTSGLRAAIASAAVDYWVLHLFHHHNILQILLLPHLLFHLIFFY